MGYAENRYSTSKQFPMPATGSLAGTNAAAVTKSRMTFMHNATVTDANVYFVAGGTQATLSLLIGKSAAGTGTITTIGTIALGTQATGNVLDGSVTETNFATGDDLIIQSAAGTSATVPSVIPYIALKEHFVNE